MNILLLIAGVLTAMIVYGHGIDREITLIRSLLAVTDLKNVSKLELRVGWHIVTLHLFASAIMLLILAFTVNPDVMMGKFLAIQFFGYGLVFLGLAIAKKVGVLQVPQWILFFLIAGLTYWGTL